VTIRKKLIAWLWARTVRAVRTAWSHVLFPVESSEAGKPFDLDHLALTARERRGVPAAVYEKASAKGAKVKLTLEIEADAQEGFPDADIGIIRDNARQLKFQAESTGFESLIAEPPPSSSISALATPSSRA
jgi:hypothetical protein